MKRFWLGLWTLLVSCAGSAQKTPPQRPPPPQYGAPYPPPYRYPGPTPIPTPGPTPPPIPQRPLLAPLFGAAMWQAEVRNVMAELIANLAPPNAAKVRGIPLVFDPNPYEVNAFAGCDERGAPFIAGTEGLLEAVDAMAQTKSTDEMLGTSTYETYTGIVAPQMARSDKVSAALPSGIIPPNVASDPRRLSRAHEIFDEIVAFTFGHELGHHWLGHTGCANGQPMGPGPNPALLGQIATSILPGLNQPNEIAADGAGAVNVLDTGRSRMGVAYRWTEAGGLLLLDYFARLDRATGITPLNPIGFLRSHPNPAIRIPIVQGVAQTWRMQHRG